MRGAPPPPAERTPAVMFWSKRGIASKNQEALLSPSILWAVAGRPPSSPPLPFTFPVQLFRGPPTPALPRPAGDLCLFLCNFQPQAHCRCTNTLFLAPPPSTPQAVCFWLPPPPPPLCMPPATLRSSIQPFVVIPASSFYPPTALHP